MHHCHLLAPVSPKGGHRKMEATPESGVAWGGPVSPEISGILGSIIILRIVRIFLQEPAKNNSSRFHSRAQG
jgi:hypothetical protein